MPDAQDRSRAFLFGGALATPARLAYGLAPLIQVLEDRGAAVEPLLAASEIPRFALEEPSYRITIEQELDFTRRALTVLDEPHVALDVGGYFHLSMFGLLGLAAACAPSVRELFHIILSYPPLAWGLIEVSVWRRGTATYVVYEPGATVGDLGEYYVARDMAATLTLFRDTLGPRLRPQAVRLRDADRARAEAIAARFGCRVTRDASADELHFASAVWEAVPPQANGMSRRFFENQCRRLAESMQGPFSFTDIVRGRLRTATPMPSLDELAGALHLTTRTLQRRLAAEDAGFSRVLREVREERARDLLRRRALHVEEVAYRLGFRDPDAFSRAFRGWTGCSPSEYRRG